MSSKSYLNVLFIGLSIIALMTTLYVSYFTKYYPLPLTDSISLDAKLKFIRDKIDVDKIDTLIIGSSLALNNVNGAVLEDTSTLCGGVVNLSAYGVTALQAEQLTLLGGAFPNLRRIVYSAQYSDFPHRHIYKDFKPKVLMKYMRKDLGIFEYIKLVFHASKNIFFCINRQNSWKEEHLQNNKFSYLGFDKSGSAPLHIYGDDIIGHRWRGPQPGIMHGESFKAVDRMSLSAKKQGKKFYFVQQGYRDELVQKNEGVKNALAYFAKKNSEIVLKNGGLFLSLHENLHLSDDYFADRSHLNDKGSVEAAKEIGRFIDFSEASK